MAVFAALLELILDAASDWVGKLIYQAASALKRGVIRLSRLGRLILMRRRRRTTS